MASFIAVATLSFLTLCLGTYIADRVEHGCEEALLDDANRGVDE